jgi:hypothetical protein
MEQPLTGTYEQMILALAERRQRVMDEGNRQIAQIGEALGQVVRDAARAAGMDESRARVEQRPTGLVLVESNATDAGGTAVG